MLGQNVHLRSETMKEIKAPFKFTPLTKPSVFLAGSIEQGKAVQWQQKVVSYFKDEDVIILNPRRRDWDSTWKQDIKNPQFRDQVEWELHAMEEADVIAMYFDENTTSPITLLELGLYAQSDKIIVCCPKGFWRKGNVDIVCSRYKVKQVKTLDTLCIMVKHKLYRKF